MGQVGHCVNFTLNNWDVSYNNYNPCRLYTIIYEMIFNLYQKEFRFIKLKTRQQQKQAPGFSLLWFALIINFFF